MPPAMPPTKLPSPSAAPPPPAAAIAVLNATNASALFFTLAPSISAAANRLTFSSGSSAPNSFPNPSVIPPTSDPSPATADPAPNATIAPLTANIPTAADFKAAPSIVSKDLIPSTKVGSALPSNQLAPAIAPPITSITPATTAAPIAI